MFDTRHVRGRKRQNAAAGPVEEEIARRLRERLGEVKGDYAKVHWVGDEGLEDGFAVVGGPYDAVVANLLLPVVNDVPLFVLRCVEALRPDGLLLLTTLGVESFREFRAAWAEVGEGQGHVIPLTDVREAGSLLQRMKLALPVVDRDVLTVTFPDFAALYKGLRAHGAGNFNLQRGKGLVGKGRMKAMEEAYARLFAREDGRLQVTLEVVYLHGFKAAAGQPVAARRGSGKVSLVRILGE
ncbi:MAG: hypothetical protein GC129_05095 [Proteobacteria bacterium]|nr:hypothetical protein [Pseudomonadota bacterium]